MAAAAAKTSAQEMMEKKQKEATLDLGENVSCEKLGGLCSS